MKQPFQRRRDREFFARGHNNFGCATVSGYDFPGVIVNTEEQDDSRGHGFQFQFVNLETKVKEPAAFYFELTTKDQRVHASNILNKLKYVVQRENFVFFQ